MDRLFRFPEAVEHELRIDAWLHEIADDLQPIAQHWFAVLRASGPDVRELMHDGHPTACVGDAAFAYVNAFRAHVNLGFFQGSALDDPSGLLEGSGKFMRHVKLAPGRAVDAAAVSALVEQAYRDVKSRR